MVLNFFPGAAVLPGEDGAVADGIAETVGGAVVGIAGTEFSGGFVVTAGETETVGDGVPVVVGEGLTTETGVVDGTAEAVADGFFDGVTVGRADAEASASFFRSSMICRSEFFRFRRGVI